MQTFLPYQDFNQSFQVLDYRRLGKQRVEAKQILNVLSGEQKSPGWKNHPAVKMWEGYEDVLKLYHDLCIHEWIKRGYKNNMPMLCTKKPEEIKFPWWLGNENFHKAMRAKLIEKDFIFYSKKFPNDKDFNNSQYFWPDNETKSFRII